jgi:3-deoxy-7-phosphoheptulonate synthase
MIIEMRTGSDPKEVDDVIAQVKSLNLEVQVNRGTERIVIAVLGANTGEIDTGIFEVFAGVEQVLRIQRPYKLASRDFKKDDTIVKVGDIEIGGNNIVMMVGPCAVEPDPETTLACARLAKQCGAQFLRGGAFKPRTGPFAFQGLGEKGLEILAEARNETGLLIVTEIMSESDMWMVAKYADVLQIGARNMQNYRLLDAVGKSHKPVLLKRGLSATVEEWLMAADYVLRHNGSSPNVILCNRGIRTFDTSTRFTFDVGVIPVLRQLTHLPIITDPSHTAGKFQYVSAFAKMAVAGGTDGLIVEIHPEPKTALCDGAHSLTFSDFTRLSNELKILAPAIGRSM